MKLKEVVQEFAKWDSTLEIIAIIVMILIALFALGG